MRIHQVDLEASNSVVWGLTKRDESQKKPSYSRVSPEDICPYPLREEVLTSRQQRIVKLGKLSAAAAADTVASAKCSRRKCRAQTKTGERSPPRKTRVSSRKVVLASPVGSPVPSTSREVVVGTPVKASTPESRPRKATGTPESATRLSDSSGASPHPRKQRSPRKRTLEETISMLLDQDASTSSGQDATWETVGSQDFVLHIPVLDDVEAEDEEFSVLTSSQSVVVESQVLDAPPQPVISSVESQTVVMGPEVYISRDVACQTDEPASRKDVGVQAVCTTASQGTRPDIEIQSGDVLVIVPQGGGRLSLN